METANAHATPSSGRAFSAALRIFSAPGSVLAEVRAGLTWWPGLLILVTVALLLGLLMLPLQRELMMLDVASGEMQGMKLDEGGQLPPAMRWTLLGGIIAGPLLGLPLMLLAVAFFYWLALTVTFGGAPYRRLFTLSVYTSFIGIAYQLINTLYLRFAGLELTTMKDIQRSSLKLSLGALVDGEGFLANFLAQIGIFQVWELWIYIAGVALLLDRKRGAVTGPVIVMFLLGAALMAFLATLGARFGG